VREHQGKETLAAATETVRLAAFSHQVVVEELVL
jgi:hypothetical protein